MTKQYGFYFDDFSLIGSGMELSDGDYDWYVEAVDNVGNAQCSQDTFSLHISIITSLHKVVKILPWRAYIAMLPPY